MNLTKYLLILYRRRLKSYGNTVYVISLGIYFEGFSLKYEYFNKIALEEVLKLFNCFTLRP